MDMITAMKIFIRVAETGNFTSAANSLLLSVSHVSRAVSELESHVEARLIQRTTRYHSITEAGARYLERCREIVSLIDQATTEASNSCISPSGCLKIHAVTEFGLECLMPLVVEYEKICPAVHVDLTLERRELSLVGGQYDILIALSENLPDSEMVAQPLGSFFSVACASPGYLEKYGIPKTVQELSQHQCLRLSIPTSSDDWLFKGNHGSESFEPGGGFKVNLSQALLHAAISDMGVCVLPTFVAAQALESGTLKRLLPEYRLQEKDISALYYSRRYLDAKIKSWIDFLRTKLPGAFEHYCKVVDDDRYWAK
ncbi:hypothetical protein BK648_07615 [Pseudomonas poae]|uniref:HTH lysR-type domain-containing protein n=1 Tax=Pseudomonas poae TaxID=200451 RepID=A0A423FAP9_9PSED|nr:LysR family transcriptional regulator [Pseudomonas poae]ROM53405.1 hypothetical protein BK648_07615 [Pseudomonas poae]